MDGAGFVIDDGDGIVDRVVAGLVQILSSRQRIDRQIAFDVDDLLSRPPRLAAVGAPPHQHVDRSPVATVTLARLTISQNRSLFGDHDAGNAIERVALFARFKEIGLFDGGCGCTAQTEQKQRLKECFHFRDSVKGFMSFDQ